TLHAQGIPDSTDTSGRRFAGTPVMKEAGEQYKGHELSYNFRTKRGKIDLGDTKIEEGFYHGETIKKTGGGDLFVREGRYTTCDLPEPHYYFGSPRMKVGVRDKVIAEPIYLYIADVPVFGLPFAVLPNRSGRRSGIITPAFGEDARRGKFLSHLGFYWATSDYMDLAVRSDLYTKGGWALYGDYRYAMRYTFSGSLTGDYKHLFTGESTDPKRTGENSYRLNLSHAQEFDPTTKLGVNFTFTSANSLVNTLNLAQALNQNIVSNATLSRSWEGTPNSISLNVARTQDLRNGNVTEVLPSVNFNHSQSFPFRSGESGPEGSQGSKSWYEDVGLGYGANFTNRLSATNKNISGVKSAAGGSDLLETVTARERDRNRTLSQSLSLNFAPRLGHVTVSPSVSYRDVRTFIENDVPARNPADSTLQTTKQTSSQKSGVVTASLSASTKFYGMAQPGVLGISAFRHTVTPNLSFSYANPITGDNRGEETMSMNFGLGNIFEMKTAVPDSGEPTKIQLLNLNAGTSYNFSADSLRLAPLSITFRTGIRNIVDIDGGASYDFYKLVETSPGRFTRVNAYLLSEQGRLARLTTFRLSLSTKVSAAGDGSTGAKGTAGGAGLPPGAGFPVNPAEYEPDFSIPWSLSLSFAFSENKVQPNTGRSSNIRGGLEFSLTEKWKVSMSGGYDVLGGELVAPDVTISRDLHCWFMNFYWVPTGAYKQYRFEIRVKASQLSDLKVTKQGSDRGFAQ
ncbi:MAG TPA: LPS assembly protein LptD, partial [Bacteroidota bacterium]|nr:LPS assembly protein LptD [Bacteroidota bacterium]